MANLVSQGLIAAGQAGFDLSGDGNLTGCMAGSSGSLNGGNDTLSPTSDNAGTLTLINETEA